MASRQKKKAVSEPGTHRRGQIEARVRRILPPDVKRIYADGMILQENDGMFIYSFLETHWPLVVEPGELGEITEVDQVCQLQVVLTPERLAEHVNILRGSVERYAEGQTAAVKDRILKILAGEIRRTEVD